jgi:hypothetical protein
MPRLSSLSPSCHPMKSIVKKRRSNASIPMRLSSLCKTDDHYLVFHESPAGVPSSAPFSLPFFSALNPCSVSSARFRS